MSPAQRSVSDEMTRLLIASTGGHLTELVLLASRFSPAASDELWITFDSKQSRTLLADRQVQFVHDTPPRDWRGVLANAVVAKKMLNHLDVEMVVSNGAGVALSFLPLASTRGIPAHYIECAARTRDSSLTGRVLQRFRGIKLYTQHEELSNARWRYEGSVFDRYRAVQVDPPSPIRKIVVTIGTLNFSFRRLLDRLKAIVPEQVNMVIQAGPDYQQVNWPGATIEGMMDPDDLAATMEDADVVIAHAGIGSALMAFEAGKSPILVPRMSSYGEHVDNHQIQIADQFAVRGLSLQADASTIGFEQIAEAATRYVTQTPEGQDFSLQ
jgi:UDP-N-acetylglucosamine--N-acetylmuramyl-(pentapeptide) pyrophosphoryl-undecaprenol N-acetylglucosamine transferase